MITIPGTAETLRVAGVESGYPSDILLDGSTSLKVRYVSSLVVNLSNYAADWLKYIGGLESFQYNNSKVEWVEQDPWNKRLSHGGLAAGTTTALTVTGAAHRFPVGSILSHPADGEFARVTAVVDANTLTIQRDITAAVTEGAWASTDEVFFAGFAMHENDNWVFRPTSLPTMPYNLSQISSIGVQESYRMMETAQYGLQGNDLDQQARDTVAQQFVAVSQATLHQSRFAGSSGVPAMQGGAKFYITSANGAQVTDLSAAALARKDIDDKLEALYYEVGGDKMAKTIVTSSWGKRKISSFFSSAERLGPGTTDAGVVVDRLNTEWGVVDILLDDGLAKNEMFFIRRENHRVGHHGTKGRPQLIQLPPSATGPRVQQVFYSDLCSIHSGVRAEGRLHNFSITS